MTTDLIERVDDMVQERSLLKHPFYQAWNKGDLPLESLRDYAGQYFHFEAAYPTFLSGLHHRCADPEVRRLILDNLWDEEHGDDNHVELWLRFCDALGLDRERVRSGPAVAATESLVGRYRELTASGPLAPGAAALYAFESQVPAVASRQDRRPTAVLRDGRRQVGVLLPGPPDAWTSSTRARSGRWSPRWRTLSPAIPRSSKP